MKGRAAELSSEGGEVRLGHGLNAGKWLGKVARGDRQRSGNQNSLENDGALEEAGGGHGRKGINNRYI